MASTAEGKALTEAHRVGQIAIGAQAEIELRLLWPMLDPSNLDRSEPAWMAASLVSMRPHYEDSTRLASAYMREYRRAEGDGSGAIVRPAWDQQYMAENLHLAGPVRVKLLTQAGAGADVAAAVAATKFAGIGRRGVMSGGRAAVDATARADARATGWRRVTDGDPCAFCAMLATRGPVYGKDTVKQTGEGLEYHGHCVIPGTEVSGPDSQVGYRRHYEGEIVTLVTAAGHELTITPNHPVLTDRGWVPAGMLNMGDNLVSSVSRERNVVSGPDVDHMPSRIEDVVSALGMVSTATRLRMPGAAEQFHGDGFDSEVHVVAANHLLGRDGKPLCEHPGFKLALHGATLQGSVLGAPESGLGAKLATFASVGAATPGFMSGGNSRLALFGAELLVNEESGFPGASWSEAAVFDPSRDGGSSNPVMIRQGEGAFPVGVTTGKIGRNREFVARRLPVARKFDTPSLDGGAEADRVFAELGGDLLHRLSGSVQLDRLVNKSIRQYSGHVLNLSTREGWYSANSITVSNCGCTAELIYGEWEPNAVEQTFIDEYNRAAAEVDALNQPRYQYNVLPRMRANGTFKDSPLRRNITSGP